MTPHRPVMDSLRYERAVEFGWRILYGKLRFSSIARSVENAYRDRDCADAGRLRLVARTAWGIQPGNTSRTRAYLRVAHMAQEGLRRSSFALPLADIGFENIRINAHAADENSCRVYIDGFDENISVFQVYKRILPAGGVAIDAGANIGIHSLAMSRCVGEKGRIYSYEPSSSIAAKFEANVALNDVRNITLRTLGVGQKPSIMNFADRAGEFNIGLSSFRADGKTKIPVTTLDSEHRDDRKVDLIKIDVEGMELDVLRGATTLIAQHQPALVLEWNEWSLQDLAGILPYRFEASFIPLNPKSALTPIHSEGQKRYGANILVLPAR